MAYTTTPNTPYWQSKLQAATLEKNKELARQHCRDDGFLGVTGKAFLQAFIDRAKTLDELKALCKSYGMEINEKEWEMDKAQELKLLKEQSQALAKRIEKLEHGRWGKEPANGSSFKIEKRFSTTGDRYTYLAYKAGGLWYLTGTGYDGTKSYTWEKLKEFAGKYARAWRMTAAEELLD